MPGLDAKEVTHKLNVDPKSRLVKQPPRKYRLDVEEKIKAEVNKLLKAGFIEKIRIRICVDFRDVNRACPKDEFPLPNVDILVDATAGHEHFYFMDDYSGYNCF